MTTTSVTKRGSTAVVQQQTLIITAEEQFTDSERDELTTVLAANPVAQKAILKLSGSAVAMRDRVRHLDTEIASIQRQWRESELYAELQEKKRFRASCLAYQLECEAQERGVWASLLGNFRKASKLYQKLLGATRALGE